MNIIIWVHVHNIIIMQVLPVFYIKTIRNFFRDKRMSIHHSSCFVLGRGYSYYLSG